VILPNKALTAFIATIAVGYGLQFLPLIVAESSSQNLSVFTLHEADGSPITWDRNIEIEILIHEDKLGDSHRKQIEKSLEWLNQELGVRSRIIGSTPIVATRKWFRTSTYGQIPPVNISFVPRSKSDLLIGSATLAATVANPCRGVRSRIITGAIAVDSLAFEALSEDHQELVLRHELGHLMGFGHDLSDLMHPTLRSAKSENLSKGKINEFKKLS
jgi:hypothetical protein